MSAHCSARPAAGHQRQRHRCQRRTPGLLRVPWRHRGADWHWAGLPGGRADCAGAAAEGVPPRQQQSRVSERHGAPAAKRVDPCVSTTACQFTSLAVACLEGSEAGDAMAECPAMAPCFLLPPCGSMSHPGRVLRPPTTHLRPQPSHGSHPMANPSQNCACTCVLHATLSQVQTVEPPSGRLYNLTLWAVDAPHIANASATLQVPTCQPGQEALLTTCRPCSAGRFCLAPAQGLRCQACLDSGACPDGMMLPKASQGAFRPVD
jgi:hypothetical protein